jgi:hypothetical protein
LTGSPSLSVLLRQGALSREVALAGSKATVGWWTLIVSE